MVPHSDEDIIRAIVKGGPDLEHVMRHLYREGVFRRQISHFVQSRGGSPEDAEDIFQDSIRNLIMSVRAGKYQGTGSIGGYLFGIGKNLWLKQFRTMHREGGINPQIVESDLREAQSPEIILVDRELEAEVDHLLGLLGDKCRKVLELWKLSYSMKEIAGVLGYKTEGVARKKKRLCMKHLLDILDQNPDLLERLKP
ncbi:MAG: sigma-70 family RNA polymerase sigma factor [Bacteroidia bacterium]